MKYLSFVRFFLVTCIMAQISTAQAARIKGCSPEPSTTSADYAPITSQIVVMGLLITYPMADWKNIGNPKNKEKNYCLVEKGKTGKIKYKSYRADLDGTHPVRYLFVFENKAKTKVFLSSFPVAMEVAGTSPELKLKDRIYHIDSTAKKGGTSIHALFDGEPSYELVRYFATGIVGNRNRPLARSSLKPSSR